MNEIIISPNLFIVPYTSHRYILYEARKGIVLTVNEAFLKVVQKAINREHLTDDERELLYREGIAGQRLDWPIIGFREPYQPFHVVLMPTRRCNLRCIYCYANAGQTPGIQDMDEELAEAAVSFAAKNAIARRLPLRVTFHGGGEPFVNFNLMKLTVSFIEKISNQNHLPVVITAGTNGILNEEQMKWVVRYLDSVVISLDGVEDIQNFQRPPNSFARVMRTIKFFDQVGFQYSIRSTITRYSQGRMMEVVKFFLTHTKCRKFHMEPISLVGRAQDAVSLEVDLSDFLREFVKVRSYAVNHDAYIFFSTGELVHSGNGYFCGALGRNFIVTPDGWVSTCFEVTHKSDSRSDVFFVGRYDRAKKEFVFFRDKLDLLQGRHIERLTPCKTCIAKYTCLGDCPARIFSISGDIYDTSSNPKCATNQEMVVENLKALVEQEV